MSEASIKETSEITIDENIICETDHLGIIKVAGEDVQAFLHGQFSNDVKALDNNQSQWNSYNNPKGRLFTTFRLCKLGQDYFMLIPQELIEPVIKRLRMFVMRSKVTLDDISSTWKILGFAGNELSNPTPTGMNEIQQENSVNWIRIPGVTTRVLCFGENENIEKIKLQFTDKLTLSTSNHWRRLDIHSGIANIFADTYEEFVAQMVNLQITDGVSFTKGCYPGQEVVARMHYLGKLKKRMYRITINSNELPTLGENIYDAASENQQSVGKIVDAQKNEKGSLDALAVIQVASVESKGLRIASVDGANISIEDLPYSFELENNPHITKDGLQL